MIAPLDELNAAVSWWVPSSDLDTGAAQGATDPKVGRLWGGPECRFLAAVRALLDPEQSDADLALASLDASLTQLTNAFSHEVAVARELTLPNGPLTVRACDDLWHDAADKLRRRLSNDETDRRRAALQLLTDEDHSAPQLAQLSLYAAGFGYAASAARLLFRWEPSSDPSRLPAGFADAAVAAMQCFAVAMPWEGAPIRDQIKESDQSHQGQSRASLRAMQTLLASDALETIQPSRTAWLTVRRLIGWLLSEPDPVDASSSGRDESVALLFVDDDNRDYSGRLEIQLVSEFQTGFYIDPIATGILLLDAEFVEALAIGFEISDNRLRDHSVELDRALAQRLQLHAPPGIGLIRGDSAGGTTALSLYAVANGRPLNPRVSGSFALRRGDDSRRIVDAGDIVLKTADADSIAPKLLAAKRARPPVDAVLVFEDNNPSTGPKITATARDVANNHGVRLIPVHSFHAAYTEFTANAELAEMLAPLNTAIVEAWEGRLTDGVAAGGKASWLRQPSPYIEPHLAELLPEHEGLESAADDDRKRRGTDSVDRASRYRWLTDDDERRNAITDSDQQQVAEDEFLRMILGDASADPLPDEAGPQPPLKRRICISEDANAGKTVLSKRLAAFFAGAVAREHLFSGQPPLVVRWENGPRGLSRHWPEDLTDLRQQLRNVAAAGIDFSGSRCKPEEAVDELLRQGRVVLILDAADQAGDDHELLSLLVADPDFDRCLVVVTGRHFAFSAAHAQHRFFREVWSFFTIMGFTENQQQRFLADVLTPEQSLHDLFADYNVIRELLAVAGMLAMVREILLNEQRQATVAADSAARPAVRLSRLKTRCDFYNEFYQRKIMEAAKKNPDMSVEEHEPRWRLMLAVTAFRMVLQRATNYTVDGDTAHRVRIDVQRYATAFAELEGDEDLIVAKDDWHRLREFSVLSDHSVLEGASDGVLSFRHKGWLEFFAGLFLANYAEPECLAEFDFNRLRHTLDPDDARQPGFQQIDIDALRHERDEQSFEESLLDAVLLQVTNDPQWYWMWRFAIEMPRYSPEGSQGPSGPADPTRLGTVLARLLLQPAREIRPNELAWRAFSFFEQTEEETPEELRRFREWIPSSVRAQALRRFRATSRDLVTELERNTAEQQRLAAERGHVVWLQQWQQASSKTKSTTLVRCPPQAWVDEFEQGQRTADPCINVMGSPDDDEDAIDCERPQHRVRLTPFDCLATPVTRGLYRDFDPAFETSQVSASLGGVIAQQIEQFASPPPDARRADADAGLYPVVTTDYFDAWVFSRWLGAEYRLPTECEQEFSIRGGTTTRYCCGDTDASLAEYAWYGENSGIRTHAVGRLRSNGYGLFDGHGQVWEWSATWWDETAYAWRVARDDFAGTRAEFEALADDERQGLIQQAVADRQRVFDADFGALSGSRVLLRGASFYYDPGYVRSASRVSVAPVSRRDVIGLRVVRVGCLASQSSSSSGTLASEL